MDNTLPEIGAQNYNFICLQPEQSSHSSYPSNTVHNLLNPLHHHARHPLFAHTEPGCGHFSVTIPRVNVHHLRLLYTEHGAPALTVFTGRGNHSLPPLAVRGWRPTRFLCFSALINYDLNPIHNTKYDELPGSRQIKRQEARLISPITSMEKLSEWCNAGSP